MKLIIAEKPSVAKSIASALGASSRADGFYEGSGLLVSWCVGHLVSPMDAGGYDERFKKWRYEDLPILPEPFRYVLAPGKEDAFENLRVLMDRPDVDTIVNACDAGREGELIFRPKLYDLTTLQREANRLFGYTAKQTLDYAQSLYEKKLLTYPRTDSRYLTSDMAETASCVIHLAAKLPPFDGCTNFFPLVETMISDKDVSDHHAIIPTMEIEKADIKGLPLGERNLFLLVCCKLLCASAEPYVYETVTATFP